MKATGLLRGDAGFSLLEAVVAIAIIAVISGIAVTAAVQHLEDARLSRAAADTQMIGISIHSFMNDTGWPPVFKNGKARSPEDTFLVLETGGSDPVISSSLHWPAIASNADDVELLENQLVKNQPGGHTDPSYAYPRMGEITYARFKGWNGPYTSSMPFSDPWSDKYLVNIQLLTAQGIQAEHEADNSFTLGTGQRAAVFVISAGPNRQIETRFDQPADAFAAGGDDVVYRIQ